MILRLLPAGIAFLGAIAWAVANGSSTARVVVILLLATADVAGIAVVWLGVRIRGHSSPARAAKLLSLSWIAVVGWGATFTALLSWLGAVTGDALKRDPSTSGLTVGALVALAGALAGVATDLAVEWTPAGVARAATARVYGADFPRLTEGGADPPAYLDAYRAVWHDPALLTTGEVIAGWGMPARRRRLEVIAAGLDRPSPL